MEVEKGCEILSARSSILGVTASENSVKNACF